MEFSKYHALGNDYLVLDPRNFPDWESPSVSQIRVICHRNFGVGSDGILWGPIPSQCCDFGLRIFNPDGSEAEKSGNGLRIFSRYLADVGAVNSPSFSIETLGGQVAVTIGPKDRLISVEMGRVSFTSDKIPVAGPVREVINESFDINGRTFTFCAATIGNPHCVIILDSISAKIARAFGPAIESHANFPSKTNVQFLKVLDRKNIQIEIWERGAGYTLASGSSSSASAAVAYRLGLVDESVTVHMPGGIINIDIGSDYAIGMTGSVNHVAEGIIGQDLFEVTV